jgi:hypothetical protein
MELPNRVSAGPLAVHAGTGLLVRRQHVRAWMLSRRWLKLAWHHHVGRFALCLCQCWLL